MANTQTPSEAAQLAQTIEMFEVITQSQPHDYQSLEILKEAYSKAGRDKDALGISKRIAQAYVQMGQLSSAILEYETILQRYPDDPDVQAALKEIESRANSFPVPDLAEVAAPVKAIAAAGPRGAAKPGRADAPEIDDGRQAMYKLFVDSKLISAGDFALCWPAPDGAATAGGVPEPFIQVLADKGIVPVEKSLKVLSDKSRAAFLQFRYYDLDVDLARTFPPAICRRWCILPFDRMGKSIFVATANPFNQQAAKELAAATASRLLWYLVPPAELLKNVRKAFR